MPSLNCRLLALASTLALAPAVWAQEAVPLPSDALQCLTPSVEQRGRPAYPPAPLARNENGRVDVELAFARADAAPEVKVLDSRGAVEFVEAVRAYAAAYRVPCLQPGRTATLRQAFDFRIEGTRNVLASRPLDRHTERVDRAIACSTQARAPAYPAIAASMNQWGTVVAKVRFESATAEPKVTVLEDADSVALRTVAVRHASSTRVPCLDGEPVEWMIYYYFRFEGDRPPSFKDISLRDLLTASKGIEQAQVYFDTRTMGCPFDLRFSHHQPHSANGVTEVGPTDPERYFFLDWLSRLQLNLPPRAHNALIGQSAKVHVPCTVIHLGAKTGGGAAQ